MKVRNGILAVVAVSLPAVAHQVTVTTSAELMSASSAAVAGDTILVKPGTYTGDISKSGDPGNLPNGTGYFWIGNDGTADHPIVVIGADSTQPPVLQGTTISSGYVFHVTGDHVVLKNLVLSIGDKGVVFDNANYGILEDCVIFNSGSELVHVRDGSSYVTLSRNRLYSSGNGGNGSVGEAFYIGTDQARWGAEGQPDSLWGSLALSEGYGGYDWRVEHTLVQCNFISGGISAEDMDIKEGTRYTVVKNNMCVGDSIALKPGAASENDSYIDQKGVKGTFIANRFWANGNSKVTKYIAEVTRVSYAHVSDSLTTVGYSSPWCDSGDADSNVCNAADNIIATEVVDTRGECAPVFAYSWSHSVPVIQETMNHISLNAIMVGRELKLSTNQTHGAVNIQLLDLHGRIVFQQRLANLSQGTTTLAIPQLPKARYLVQVSRH